MVYTISKGFAYIITLYTINSLEQTQLADLINSLLRNNKGFQSELRPTELRLTELRGIKGSAIARK